MLVIGGYAMKLNETPLARPEDYLMDLDLYGTLEEFAALQARVEAKYGRPQPTYQFEPLPRFAISLFKEGPIEFDCLTPELIELAEALPDNTDSTLLDMPCLVASPLTVQLIKLAYVENQPAEMMLPKHAEDLADVGGPSAVMGMVRGSQPHAQFYDALAAEILRRLSTN